VPTPFYHLWIAQDLYGHPGLAADTRRFLQRNRAAFWFGNTAPDVQVLSGQSRQATHFFPFPIPPGQPPPVTALLSMHPELANPSRLPEAQAAFCAGYCCHLHADWLWVGQIFGPIFGPEACWGDAHECVYIHNVLRAYLDRKVLPLLDGDTGAYLQKAEPAHWLPFIDDKFLRQWRDFLASQLAPQAAVQTVAVFAARQGLTVDAFHRLLDSEDRMEQEVFIHLSRRQVEVFRERLLEESVQLLSRYLGCHGIRAYRPAAAGVVLP
jgi:hypothetical protein